VSIFNFNLEELLTFCGVLIRYSILFSILPFIGDKMIPAPVKVLLSLSVSVVLFPSLLASGKVNPRDALVWGSTASGIMGTIALEVLFALCLGFSARLVFDGISFGANLVGNFMGFASASIYDPHQETHTEIIAHLQNTIAMLVFLSLDGHHLMLRAALDSYRFVGLGKMTLQNNLGQRLVALTGEVFQFGLQIAAPVAISLFAVNIVFGVLSKAMPQLNVFMLSGAVTALLGFIVMWISVPEFQGEVAVIFGKIGDWMQGVMMALGSRS
jgi:flagellar biosynthetic protein FliR